MELRFSATILQNENMDAAYVEVHYDIKELFGKGRLLVNATFDGIPYRGHTDPVCKSIRPILGCGSVKERRIFYFEACFLQHRRIHADCGEIEHPPVCEPALGKTLLQCSMDGFRAPKTAEFADQFPIITKNGYGDLVVMSIETYEQIAETQLIDNAIAEAEEEYEKTGILLDAQETLAGLKNDDTLF